VTVVLLHSCTSTCLHCCIDLIIATLSPVCSHQTHLCMQARTRLVSKRAGKQVGLTSAWNRAAALGKPPPVRGGFPALC
jgi:hypothetical protein